MKAAKDDGEIQRNTATYGEKHRIRGVELFCNNFAPFHPSPSVLSFPLLMLSPLPAPNLQICL